MLLTIVFMEKFGDKRAELASPLSYGDFLISLIHVYNAIPIITDWNTKRSSGD